MKRFLLILSVLIFLPCFNVFGQFAVVDAGLSALIGGTWIEEAALYAEMIAQDIIQINNLVQMVENAGKQIDMAAQNMKSIKDINSWDDFMDFYNRQLYYERRAIESVKGMNVTIGKKNYSLYDLEGIADGLNDTYIEYWNKEFTEDQIREMWLGLGLSPANYAFVQPYKIKNKEVARQLLAMSDMQNEKNKKTSEANKKDIDDLAADSKKPLDEQMGEKEVQQRILVSSIRNGETLGDIAAIEAKRAEKEGLDEALNKPLKQTPKISSWENGFESFKK
jgi:hypothetical protein